MEQVAELIDMFGVDEVIEHIASACREEAEQFDEKDDEENARKWRVRGNGVMQALRFYQAFVKERDA